MQQAKNQSGSIKNVWEHSLPPMISCFSSYIMWFIDRCFLSYYSLEALNATVTASALAWGFLGGAAVMAGMIELFVAQYEGANQSEKIGPAIWQMIWFSLFTSLIFIPIGIWGTDFFYTSHSMEASYFRWTICFGFFQPLIYTLTSFFVGRGHSKAIISLALFSTLFYIVIDKAFIFGVANIIPKMGSTGAAIAGCLTLALQAIILFICFILPNNRKTCNTHLWHFDWTRFIKFSRVAGPPAILYNIEQLGWSLFYSLMFLASPIHITISSLCQGLILLFSFLGDGLARGSSVLANNSVGAGNFDLVRKVWRSTSLILIFIFLFQVLILLIKPTFFIRSFLPTTHSTDLFGGPLEGSLWFVLIFLLFQGFQWVLSGLLHARGESFFVMFSGSLSIWLFLISPAYFFIIERHYSVLWAWFFVAFYSIMCTLIYFWRWRTHHKEVASISFI